MSATGKMPPLPDLDPTAVGLTPEEQSRQRTGMALYTGEGNAPGFDKSFVAQQIQTAHAARLATAKRHYQTALTNFQILTGGKSPINMNPDGSAAPLTDEEKQSHQMMLDQAWEDLSKIPGLDKDVKTELQNRKQMMDTVIQHGHERVGQVAQAIAGQAGQAGQAAPGTGKMPPPPGAEPPPAPPSPPPSPGNMFNSPPGLMAPLLAQTTQPAMIARGETQQNVEAARTAGIAPGTPNYQAAVLEHKLAPVPTIQTNNYIDPADGHIFNGVVDKTSGNIIDPATKQVVPGAVKATAAEQAAPTPYPASPTERPYAVKHGDKVILEGDPNLSKADADMLKASQKAYDDRQALLAERASEAQDRYALMRGKVMQYNVWDRQTGAQHMVNANTINEDPTRYMAGAPGQVLANRATALVEIKNSSDILSKAVNALSDSEDWNPESRLAVATALRNPDPASAQSLLINSIAAGKLTEKQAEYAMAIQNAVESVMRIGVVTGLGAQATDQMRTAIVAMLPSGATPNKAFAQRQLQLVKQQFDIFGTAIPSMEKLGLTPPPGAGGGGGGASAKPPIPTTPLKAGNEWRYSASRGKWAQGKEVNGKFTPDAGQ